MPDYSYTSRREREQYHFHPLVAVLAPPRMRRMQTNPRLRPLDVG